MTELPIDAARSGNRAARETIVRALQDVWYRFCLSQLRDSNLAMDAAQETALRFLRDLSKFDGRSSIKTWSIGIALNVVRETRRRRFASGAEVPDREDEEAESPPAMTISRDEATQVQALLADLPDRQREALTLRFFENLSVEETAAAMGAAAGTVKATVHQALRSLRKRMGLAASE